MNRTRRSLLAAATGVAVAGCTQPGGPADTESSTAVVDDTRTAATVDGTTADDATTDDLDLREANVVGVAVESNGGEEYRVSVTLIHDDDGEDGFADWWQVETRDGERLGRRELAHAHGTREFTRSATITVPDAHRRVVVRGHDQTHGYGGRAALVTIPDGETTFVQQGSDPLPLTPTADTPTADTPTDGAGDRTTDDASDTPTATDTIGY